MAEPQGAGVNAQQAAEWDGPAGAHRTRHAAVFDAEDRPHNERFRAAEDTMRPYRPADVHFYLQGLGTDPPRQGEGLGSAVLQPVLARCDRDGLPAYLETTKERNVGFYQSHGFAVVARTRLPLDGPPMWFMWREPAESRTAG